MNAKYQRAYTLVEAMIVLCIASILAAVAYPSYSNYLEENKVLTATKDISLIEMEIAKYFATNSEYPPDLATVGKDIEDPWGNEYKYLSMELANGNGDKRKDRNLVPINTDYDLYSMGPDGRSVSPLTGAHSRDDIVRANNGAFIGPAEDY